MATKLAANAAMDGFTALTGVDSGRSPSLLGETQAAFAINTTFRGGFAQPRPGMNRLPVGIASGRWQGCAFYDSPTKPGFVFSVSGRIYFVDPTLETVIEITPESGPNSALREQAWFCQAEEYMIVQDGQSKPIVWNGATARRLGDGELPVGTVMTYGMGRVWLALPSRRHFVAGDLVYSTTGQTRDVLGFTENAFLNGGGAFAVPVAAGQITAMRFTAQQDTSIGQGPLLVFTENSAFSVRAPVEREVWQNLTYPIQTVALLSYGALAQASTILVNGDVWYRAKDGIRSFALAQRQQADWASTPLSKEVSRATRVDDESLLQYGSAVLFDNRLLMLASPYRTTAYGYPHRGMLVLDYDPLSTMTSRSAPQWDGMWCGARFLSIVKGSFGGRERCYFFALNASNVIELWELTTDARWDNDETNIDWMFESRAMGFASPGSLKELETAELWRDRLAGRVFTSVKWRPDQFSCWIDWHTWSEQATYRNCEVTPGASCLTVHNYKPQYRPRVRLPKPPEACDPILSRPYSRGSEFQVRLGISGYCRVKAVRLQAWHVQEDVIGDCPLAEDSTAVECCDEMLFPQSGQELPIWVTDGGDIIITDGGEQIIIQ